MNIFNTMTCINMAQQDQFQKYGGTLLENHKVTEIIPGDVVTVVTNRGTFKAKNIVIAAGPWAPALCSSIGVHLPFKVYCIVCMFFCVQDILQDILLHNQ